MGKVIDPHVATLVWCATCSHRWAAVRSVFVPVVKLECPACGDQNAREVAHG